MSEYATGPRRDIPGAAAPRAGGPLARRRFVAAAGAGLAAALAGCVGGSGPDGTDDLTLESLDVGGSPGGPLVLRPTGKVALLDFFATWCAPCKPEMANLRGVRATFSEQAVAMRSITQETDATAVRRFWRRYEGTWPVAMDVDLEATRAYDVTGVPTIVVLTPGGEVVMRHTGLAGRERIEAAIDEALRRAGGV